MLERRRSRSGRRAVVLSLASVLATPGAWIIERILARSLRQADRRTLAPDPESRLTLARTSAGPAMSRECRGAPPIVLFPDLLDLTGEGASETREHLGPLFRALTESRTVWVYELPESTRGSHEGTPLERTAYLRAVEAALTDAHARAGRAVDAIAVGLTCELLAIAASRAPEHVRSASMIAPDGFSCRTLSGFIGHRVEQSACKALAYVLDTALYRVRLAHDTRTRAILRARLRAERPGDIEDTYDSLVLPTLFVTGQASPTVLRRVRDLVGTSSVFHAATVDAPYELAHRDAPSACVGAITAFHRSLHVRPALRILRGGRTGAPTPRAHLHLATVHHA